MKTIAKNRIEKINEIFQKATHCVCYCLENSFQGTECSPWYAKKELETFDFARLRHEGDNNYTVRIHSNCWYEIKSPVYG